MAVVTSIEELLIICLVALGKLDSLQEHLEYLIAEWYIDLEDLRIAIEDGAAWAELKLPGRLKLEMKREMKKLSNEGSDASQDEEVGDSLVERAGKSGIPRPAPLVGLGSTHSPDWIECYSPDDKCCYYFNRVTQVTQWEPPSREQYSSLSDQGLSSPSVFFDPGSSSDSNSVAPSAPSLTPQHASRYLAKLAGSANASALPPAPPESAGTSNPFRALSPQQPLLSTGQAPGASSTWEPTPILDPYPTTPDLVFSGVKPGLKHPGELRLDTSSDKVSSPGMLGSPPSPAVPVSPVLYLDTTALDQSYATIRANEFSSSLAVPPSSSSTFTRPRQAGSAVKVAHPQTSSSGAAGGGGGASEAHLFDAAGAEVSDSESSSGDSSSGESVVVDLNLVARLREMGFNEQMSIMALKESKNSLSTAAVMLLRVQQEGEVVNETPSRSSGRTRRARTSSGVTASGSGSGVIKTLNLFGVKKSERRGRSGGRDST